MTIGRHLILDLYGCDCPSLLSSEEALKSTLGAASRKAGATVLSYHSHPFVCRDSGMMAWSITTILEESHANLHSWPHERFVSLDIYVCGEGPDPMKALNYLLAIFNPVDYQMRFMVRGDKTI